MFTITHQRSVRHPLGERETMTLERLCALAKETKARTKESLPLYIAGTFESQERTNESLIALGAVMGDYDTGQISPQDAAERLQAANVHGAIISSPRHMVETGKGCGPRWRVICPLSKEIVIQDHRRLAERLNGVFGQGVLGTEGKSASRAYYYGSLEGQPDCETYIVQGRPIDTATEIAGLPFPKSECPIKLPDLAINADAAEIGQAVLEGAATFTGGHEGLRPACMLLAPFVRLGAVSFEDVAARLQERLIETSSRGDEVEQNEAERTLTWAKDKSDYVARQVKSRLADIERGLPVEKVARSLIEGLRLLAVDDFDAEDLPDLVDPRDMVVDFWDELPAPAFDATPLPDVIRRYVREQSRIIGCDPCALSWACLAACSAAINGAFRIRMKRHDGWHEPPALWVGLVGDPAAKKSPIMRAAWAPLQKIEAAAFREHKVLRERYDALDKEAQKATETPAKPPQRIVNNTTVEALQDILEAQNCGTSGFYDELIAFLAGMDQYKKAAGGDRSFYLEAFGGGSYIVNRVGRGTKFIENCLVRICGGIQPAKLSSLKGLTDDGLWQRFIPVITPVCGMGVDEPSGAATDAYRKLIEDLTKLSPTYADVRFTETAHKVREDIERRAHDYQQSKLHGASFATFAGKLAAQFGRLALVLACIEHCDRGGDEIRVNEITALRAQRLILESALPNAVQVYATIGGGGADQETSRDIAGYILSKKLSKLTPHTLTRNVRCCRGATLEDVRRMLSPLVAGGWLTPESDYPSNKAWDVSPAAHLAFAARADAERRYREQARAEILRSAEAPAADDADMME